MNAKTPDPKSAAVGEGADQKRSDESSAAMPPAGPHAESHLINPDATPGTGSLPAADHDEAGTDPGGG